MELLNSLAITFLFELGMNTNLNWYEAFIIRMIVILLLFTGWQIIEHYIKKLNLKGIVAL